MITPQLEKLILQGKAFYDTFVFGASGNAFMPVNESSFVIITGFTSFHFSNSKDEEHPEYLHGSVNRSVYQLKVKSGSQKNTFVLRSDLTPLRQKNGKADKGGISNKDDTTIAIANGSTYFNTYIICKSDVIFNISMANSAIDFNDAVYAAIADGAADDKSPSGYADIPTSQIIDWEGVNEYVPLTKKGYRSAVAPMYKEQLFFPINWDNKLETNNGGAAEEPTIKNRMYPIINLELVRINEDWEKFIGGNM